MVRSLVKTEAILIRFLQQYIRQPLHTNITNSQDVFPIWGTECLPYERETLETLYGLYGDATAVRASLKDASKGHLVFKSHNVLPLSGA